MGLRSCLLSFFLAFEVVSVHRQNLVEFAGSNNTLGVVHHIYQAVSSRLARLELYAFLGSGLALITTLFSSVGGKNFDSVLRDAKSEALVRS